MKFQFDIIYFMLCRLSRVIWNRESSKQETVNIRASLMINYKVSMFPICELFIIVHRLILIPMNIFILSTTCPNTY